MKALLSAAKTVKDVAEVLGITKMTVYQVKKQLETNEMEEANI